MRVEEIKLVDKNGNLKKLEPIRVGNDGIYMTETNYWHHELAVQGLMYLSGNAGAIRLLVPPKKESYIPEIKTGKSVEIESGVLKGRAVFNLFFVDGTPTPFMVSLQKEMSDRTLKRKDNGWCLVYTQQGLQHWVKYKVLS